MKKMFLAAVLVAVSLASCQDELTEVNNDYEKVVVSRSTEKTTETESKKRGEHERLSEYLARIRGEGPQRKK